MQHKAKKGKRKKEKIKRILPEAFHPPISSPLSRDSHLIPIISPTGKWNPEATVLIGNLKECWILGGNSEIA